MINTTPLIDLMLVLLVMFLVSIPIATHKVPLDVPPPVPGPPPAAPVHRLELDAAGRLFWNARPIADAELAPRLALIASDPALPELHVAPAGETRYERVDQILAAIARAGITRMGFVGNERFAATMDRRSR
jgi:biopolymer transport protein ExbD